MTAQLYEPCAKMCLACKDFNKVCSNLNFQTMEILYTTEDINVVKCSNYKSRAPVRYSHPIDRFK